MEYNVEDIREMFGSVISVEAKGPLEAAKKAFPDYKIKRSYGKKKRGKTMIKSKRCWTNACDITDMIKTRLYFNKQPFLFENFIQQIINDNEHVTDAKLYIYAKQIKDASDTTDFITDIMFRLSQCTYTIYYEVIDNETN